MTKELAFIAATALLFTASPVYANVQNENVENSIDAEDSETIEDDSEYQFLFDISYDDTLIDLTLDEAVEDAISNSTSIKTSKLNLETMEENIEETATDITYNRTQDSIATLLSFLSQQNNYKNSEMDLEVSRQKIAHEMKKLFMDIINMEREISLKEDSIKVSQIEYNEAQTKFKNNLISSSDFKAQGTAYQKEKSDLEALKNELDITYKNLNVLMGKDENTRYNISLDPEYEKIEDITDINYYASREADNTVTMQKLKNDLEYAEIAAKNEYLKESSTYMSEINAENNAAITEMNLNDTKEQLEQSIVSLYYSIKNSEQNMESLYTNYETAITNYEASKIKYDAGLISLKDLETAKKNLHEAENSLIKSLYENMINVEKFNNLNLL